MELIKIGKIVNTHGIKGELRILSKFPYKEKFIHFYIYIFITKFAQSIAHSSTFITDN